MLKFSARQITVVGILGGITVVLGLLPVGGFIPVPTPAGSATTMHIPTILAGIFDGPVVGGVVGAIFGAFSFYRALTSANPVARLMFTNPVVAFIPRILIGIVSYYVFRLAKGKKGRILLAVAAFLVLGHTGFYVFASKGKLVQWFAAVAAGTVAVLLVFLVNRRYNATNVALGALAGSLTNTAGVLGLCVLFGYIPYRAAIAIGLMHGIPEALVAMILTDLIYRSISKMF